MRPRLALIALLISAAGAPAAQADVEGYESIFEELGRLVAEFKASRPGVKAVLVGEMKGSHREFLRGALQEALLSQGITKANTREEMAALRENYRKQGVDIYKDPAFQKALRAASKARITLTVENRCEVPAEAGLPQSCVIWLRALLPTRTIYTGHRSYSLSPPSRYGDYSYFLFLLAIYAFLPPLVHRIDIALRRPDGGWRSILLFPFHLVGNRIVIFLFMLTFLWAGPYFYELWVDSLEEGLEPALKTLGIAFLGMVLLNLLGALFVALWRERARHSYGHTFRELFILHPHFWSREVEGRIDRGL